MYLHNTLNTTYFSNSYETNIYSPLNQTSKNLKNQIFAHGFCKQAKRVSKLLKKRVNDIGFGKIKCDLNFNGNEVENQILTYGFCKQAKRVPKSLTKRMNDIGFGKIKCELNFNGNEVENQTLTYGFCKQAKRVPKSLTKRMNDIGFGKIICELSLNENEVENGEKDDEFYMRRCVEIARKAIGCTSPNPMVGCVIVKNGKIVGEGFHPKAGQPHAEVFALRDAGDLAENATAYVSLEPCNHYGRTPPCSEALIKAKVKKVVVGMVDPNPIVASKGVDKLRNAGIEVKVGVEEELCNKLNEAYIHQMLSGRPFVTMRYSLSVNGQISTQLGEDVTKPGGYYSKLLQEYDAIILSSNSLLEKPMFPSSSEPRANQPLKIVLAKNSISAIQVPELSADEVPKVIIFTDKERVLEPETAPMGIETVCLEKMSLLPILEYCKSRGSSSVLLDIRGSFEDFEQILEEGYEQNLFQKVVVEMLPIWDGNQDDKLSTALKSLKERKKLRSLTSRNLGKSILLEGYF